MNEPEANPLSIWRRIGGLSVQQPIRRRCRPQLVKISGTSRSISALGVEAEDIVKRPKVGGAVPHRRQRQRNHQQRGRGYRFTAAVTQVEAELGREIAATSQTVASPCAPRSILVLPFTNLSDDPEPTGSRMI